MTTNLIPQESVMRGKMMAALYENESLMTPQRLEIVDVISTDFPQIRGEFVIVISDQKPTEDRPWNTRYVSIFGYDHLGIERSKRPIATTQVLDSTDGLMNYPEAIRNWLRALPHMPQYMLEESTWPISNSLKNASVTLSVLYSLLYGRTDYGSNFIEEIERRFPGQLENLIQQWSAENLWIMDNYKRKLC